VKSTSFLLFSTTEINAAFPALCGFRAQSTIHFLLLSVLQVGSYAEVGPDFSLIWSLPLRRPNHFFLASSTGGSVFCPVI
jgi:hypothetical protein